MRNPFTSHADELEAAGVHTVVGTVVNAAGLTHAKTVPLSRIQSFIDPGLGASPVWHVFAIDQAGIAFTGDISAVGDERVRIDPGQLHHLGNGLAWAPGSFFDQQGAPIATCARGTLQRVAAKLSDHGLEAQVGHEMEFVLVAPDGARLPSTLWAQYGLAGILESEDFVRDVTVAAAESGLPIEQFHPEYGQNQFEISLSPADPVAAADQLILARIIVSRVARRHGLRVSLSPVPFAGSVGSGAHQHFSLTRAGIPLFSGGSEVAGLTPDGARAIAGLLDGLAQSQGIFGGSILSGLRLLPGHWSGAFATWGTENREAAVRYLGAGASNPYGANVEVKIVDPSANPYLASAAILGLALDGIEGGAILAPQVTIDPTSMSGDARAEAGIATLAATQSDVLAALDGSTTLRAILGDPVIDTVLAVRRYEHENFGELDPEELAEKFRMAWSL
ncbi:MAG: glutamine synthetase family protein [Mycobacterium sp.]